MDERVHQMVSYLLNADLEQIPTPNIASLAIELEDTFSMLDGPKEEEVVKVVARFNQHKLYEQTVQLVSRWVGIKGFQAKLIKHKAQALINLGKLQDARSLLESQLEALIKISQADFNAKDEIPEFKGLLARIAKQEYVQNSDLNSLVDARQRYLTMFREMPSKNYWHGINAAALRACEEMAQLGIEEASSRSIAEEVLAIVLERNKQDPQDRWLYSTASEACLALDNCDLAELWLSRFLLHPKTTPFEVDSYDRQLREVWKGNPIGVSHSCADRLSTITTGFIAQKAKRFSIAANNIADTKNRLTQLAGSLEKNFLGESTFDYETILSMLNACDAIGCVHSKSGRRVGTGFLVRKSDLIGGEDTRQVFITNSHVLSNEAEGAIPPDEAFVTFEVELVKQKVQKTYKVEEVLFTSPLGELSIIDENLSTLDVTIVYLENVNSNFTPLKLAKSIPLAGPKTKVFVVGHPHGAGLQISLHDSQLLDVDEHECLLHYRTPTEPGNSGSPVFNQNWEVIGIHHAGSVKTAKLHGEGVYEANEGISLKVIAEKWKQNLL